MFEVQRWKGTYWKVLTMGSGFIINDAVVGTAAHVVDLSPRKHCPPTVLPQPCILRLVVKTFLGNKLTSIHPAYVLGADENDLAVVYVPTLLNVKPAKFAEQILVDSDVIKAGNPLGVPNVLTQGKITCAEEWYHLEDDPKPYKLVMFSASTEHGDSGGGVLNNRDEVVGVTIAMAYKDGSGLMAASYRFKWLLNSLTTRRVLVYKKNKDGVMIWRVRH